MQTESSETTEKLIKLGKLILDELGKDSERDTLTSWMVHYLAQQIDLAETSTGKAKDKANAQCCEAILKIWSHHQGLPDGSRPFEQYDEIFETIKQLNPEKPSFHYAGFFNDDELADDIPQSIKQWMGIASGADRIARELIQLSLSQASLIATDDTAKKWLEAAGELDDSGPIPVINLLIGEQSSADDKLRKKKMKSLEGRITIIKSFIDNGENICSVLNEELEQLKSEANQHNDTEN